MNSISRCAIFCVLLAGCATTQSFKEDMNSWLGSNVNDFIAQTGFVPESILPDSDGKMYVFQVSSTGYYHVPQTTNATVYGSGNTATGTATTTGGYSVPLHYNCQWIFRTSSSGIIQSWSARGNSCKS